MEQSQGYAIIILAAGNSSRLGEPKQLLKYQGKTLISNIAEAAIASKSTHVIVVTGSNASLIDEALHLLPHHTIHNPDWETGMASSIVAGIKALLTMQPNIAGAILAVSDQPFVTSGLFDALIQKALETVSGIIASSYDDTQGTPILFSNPYFPSLMALTGAEGAKKLVKRFAGDVETIPFPKGGIDIDTQDDYRKLLGN